MFKMQPGQTWPFQFAGQTGPQYPTLHLPVMTAAENRALDAKCAALFENADAWSADAAKLLAESGATLSHAPAGWTVAELAEHVTADGVWDALRALRDGQRLTERLAKNSAGPSPTNGVGNPTIMVTAGNGADCVTV